MEQQENFQPPTCTTVTILDEDLYAIEVGLLAFLSCLKTISTIYVLTKLRPLLLTSMYHKPNKPNLFMCSTS